MKHFCVRSCAQLKARDRETLKTMKSNNDNDTKVEDDEDDESSAKEDVDNIFIFVITVPDEDPGPNQKVQEWRQRSDDAEAAKIDFERVSANWIKC